MIENPSSSNNSPDTGDSQIFKAFDNLQAQDLEQQKLDMEKDQGFRADYDKGMDKHQDRIDALVEQDKQDRKEKEAKEHADAEKNGQKIENDMREQLRITLLQDILRLEAQDPEQEMQVYSTGPVGSDMRSAKTLETMKVKIVLKTLEALKESVENPATTGSTLIFLNDRYPIPRDLEEKP